MGTNGKTPGILPAMEGIWGFAGTARYGKIGGDTGLNYYVDKNKPTANDANDGTDPEAPFATIQAAIDANNALINWGNTPSEFNTIWIAPGSYAENLTPPYYCAMIGTGMAIGNSTDICVEVHPAAGSALAGTGLGLCLYNIRFTTDTAAPVLDFDVLNSCIIERCAITDGNPGLATVGIDTTDANSTWIVDCVFKGNSNPLTRGIRSTGDFYSCRVINCEICAVTTGIDLSGAALCGNSVARDNLIWSGGGALLTTGINDSVVGDLFCVNNYIVAVDAISHADANMTIGNHVNNNGVGAIELVGT
jgi:hypothetical protein